MSKPRKTPKPVKAWAVCNSAGRPYLDTFAELKRDAIHNYIGPRGYVWDACVQGDGATCRRVLIRVLP